MAVVVNPGLDRSVRSFIVCSDQSFSPQHDAEEDGKIVDGGLLGDANGVGSGSVRQKDSGNGRGLDSQGRP
ncbi:hypothetical protein QTP86_011049 [Hemibagrus guttatus]|nr:hypothetical protein QTP86_011049 [Hemibagrus guttatus]